MTIYTVPYHFNFFNSSILQFCNIVVVAAESWHFLKNSYFTIVASMRHVTSSTSQLLFFSSFFQSTRPILLYVYYLILFIIFIIKCFLLLHFNSPFSVSSSINLCLSLTSDCVNTTCNNPPYCRCPLSTSTNMLITIKTTTVKERNEKTKKQKRGGKNPQSLGKCFRCRTPSLLSHYIHSIKYYSVMACDMDNIAC